MIIKFIFKLTDKNIALNFERKKDLEIINLFCEPLETKPKNQKKSIMISLVPVVYLDLYLSTMRNWSS